MESEKIAEMSTPDMEVEIPVVANIAYSGELAAASEDVIESELETETDMDSDAEAEGSKSRAYPLAEATYDEVVQNDSLFSDKLKSFNSSFFSSNIKFPSLIENELDLHRLFVEVTSLGGLEKVIKEQKWKEVASLFNVNSSFLLRKCYISSLYHFEQCYYFRRSVPRTVPANESTKTGLEVQHKGRVDVQSQANSANSGLAPGITLIGTIDNKCDNGYVVSVNVGGCGIMKGILYHIPDMPMSSSGNPPETSTVITQQQEKQHRRKYRLTSRDPLKPKPNRSGYTFFFEEQYAKLRLSYQGQERGISKKIGQLWNRLSEAEKQVYQVRGLQDKERYQKEMTEYNLSHGQ